MLSFEGGLEILFLCLIKSQSTQDKSLPEIEVKAMHRNKATFLNWFLCKAADQNWEPVEKKGVCLDSNRAAQPT